MRTAHRHLDPAALSRLSSMELVARLVVEGFVTGLHKSPYQGFSVEFAEHRQYMPGDESRDIDWIVFGKSDRYYVKKFEEETNLRTYIVLDASASMDYKYDEEGITKFEYGCYLAASLSYLMLKQRLPLQLIALPPLNHCILMGQQQADGFPENYHYVDNRNKLVHLIFQQVFCNLQ